MTDTLPTTAKPLTLPRISIVVPNFNSGKTLGGALQSLIDQQYPDLEILVVDGGSSDDSVEVIRRYEAHLTWWVSEPDRGQAHAINKGMARATGQLMNWLCGDDRLLPGALHTVGRCFAEDPSLDVLVGGGRFVAAAGGWESRRRAVAEAIELLPVNTLLMQPSCFYHRRLLDRPGPLDESYHYSMDLELWCYFKSRHARWRFLDEELSIAVVDGTNKTSIGRGKIRRELGRVYRAYSNETISLLWWNYLCLLPLDYVRVHVPIAAPLLKPVRLLLERVLGKFYGFPKVHALDWSWTLKRG